MKKNFIPNGKKGARECGNKRTSILDILWARNHPCQKDWDWGSTGGGKGVPSQR